MACKFSSIVLLLSTCVPALFYSCRGTKNAAVPSLPLPVPNNQHVSVLTQHNNNNRTGWNASETSLNVSNVKQGSFGRIFSLVTDDQVYAQPLVLAGTLISGSPHNVVFIATVGNTIYAYDGDSGFPYWKKNYTLSGMRPPRNSDVGDCGGPYQDFSGNFGIVGTPVLDSIAQTLYFVSRSTDGNNFVQYLHAVSCADGSERSGSPVKIDASYAGTGDGNVNGTIRFDARKQNQRQALLLTGGRIYLSFSSHCDIGPYHGWILGYDAGTLIQNCVYNDTPDGSDGGLWESAMGMAADPAGNLYLVSGNGTVGLPGDPANPRNRGESALKLSPDGASLTVNSFFTPMNYQDLEYNDQDYGSMGALLIPGANVFFTGAKDGNLYLLDKDQMGGWSATANQVLQTVSLGASKNLHCQAACYQGAGSTFLYVWSENDALKSFPFNMGTRSLGNPTSSAVSGPLGQNGATLSVSSNGSTAGTAVLWASHAWNGDAEHAVRPGILRAFDASDVTREIWNNRQDPADAAPDYAKFNSVTVANGHVYLPSFSNSVVVYGLKK